MHFRATKICQKNSTCLLLSVLLQRFCQQVVEAGNHRPGIVVQARRDHGVVVNLNKSQVKVVGFTFQFFNFWSLYSLKCNY